MKKLLIIEDKTTRQKENISYGKLDTFNNILKNVIDDDYTKIFEQFKNSDFNILEKYEYIAIHESAFKPHKEKIFENIKEYIKGKEKKLILFSGGSFNTFLQEPQNILYLSDITFYRNLEIFLDKLDKKDEDILMLAYGEYYHITSLLEIKKNITRFLDDNKAKNKFRFKSVLSKTNFNQIDNYINFYDYKEEDHITKESLINIIEKIEQTIKDAI